MRSVFARPASLRGDEPALAGDERLGRREAEHLGVAEAADRPAVGERAERVGGVEDDRDAARPAPMLDDALGVARRAEDVRREQRCRPVEAARPRGRGRSGTSPGRTRRTRASRPFHATACADAENVKLGSTTGPGRPSVSACTTSIRPEVHELTATTCATPRRSAMRSSSSATSGPFVSMPLSYDGFEPAPDPFERRAGRPGEGQAGAKRARRRAARAAWRPGPSVRAGLGARRRPPGAPSGRGIGAHDLDRFVCGSATSSCRWHVDAAAPQHCASKRRDRGLGRRLRALAREQLEEEEQRRRVGRRLRLQAPDRRVARRLDRLGVVVQLLVQPLARPGAGDLDLDVLVGAETGKRIIWRARSMIDTGLPMSSRKTLPSSAIAPACSTRLTASGIVMK